MKLNLDRLFRPRKTPSSTQAVPHVTFDRYSLIIDGKRTVIRSGTFHYFRLPVPEAWKDRLLKIKRAGYNTVDLYFHWGYHSPANGVYDFEGPRDVEHLLRLCQEAGLYVIARPGPYICAEVDGGGHPAWLLAQDGVHLRCRDNGAYLNSPKYREYARQWYEQIVPRIIKFPHVILFQIENEYANDDLNPGYMQFLRDVARELGVKVPIIHNDLWKQGCWADVVDIYGVDDYAVASFSRDWREDEGVLAGLDGLGEVKKQYCTRSPLAVFELQGGWFDPWTGIGYEEIRRRLGRANLELVTWTALAQGVTIYSHYMFAGGTNWDYLGAPCVYTSYDFAAPIYEWGGISDRYQVAKAIAMLVGAFEELFVLSEPCEDVQASDPRLLYKARRYGDTYLAFLRNFSGETRSTTVQAGDVATEPVTLAPWSMRVVFLNLPFVDGRVTTNCNILTALHQENQHLIVFYGPGRVTWRLPASCRLLRHELNAAVEGTSVVIDYDGTGWKDVVFSSGGHRYRSVFIPDADEAWLVDRYFIIGASYAGEGRMKGGVVDLPRYEMRIQTAGPKEKTIRVYSVGHLNRAEINDQMVYASYDSIAGYLRFEMPRAPEVSLPSLGPWRVRQAFEPSQPHPATGWRVLPERHSLEMDKLGIYKGFAWYRAAYLGKMRSISLAIRHNAAVYFNGQLVAKLDNYQPESTDGEPESEHVEPTPVELPVEMQKDGENVLTVLVESLGHNKGFLGNERLPRGILGVQADRPLSWSVRAGVAGEDNVTRPEFDDSAWQLADDLAALPEEDVLWARTRFRLNLPTHVYAPIGLRFAGIADKAHIYLNGVLIARDWSVCPQRVFYLPEGVLNTQGENVLTLLLWRRGGTPSAGTVELQAYTVETSNFVNVL